MPRGGLTINLESLSFVDELSEVELQDLVVNYGGVQAVDDISIKVKAGELVSITGANGAGKSSMLNAIAGILAVASGKIVFAGEDITGLRAHQIVEKGIVQVPEGRQLFATLTVRENLLAGGYANSRFLLDQVIPESIVQRFPVLGERLDSLGSSLSGGQAQMLALARGLMNHPELLLLDEPTLGLAPIAVKEVFDLIAQLRDQGLTILVVEQNVRQVLEISDYAYVLESAKIVMEGKGGFGGLADIEFAVQILQMMHGKKNPRLRVTNTLASVAQFSALGMLDHDESEGLRENYLFLRNLECALRIINPSSTNHLPKEEGELLVLAKLLGYADKGTDDPAGKLMEDYDRNTKEVRAFYRKTIDNLLRTSL